MLRLGELGIAVTDALPELLIRNLQRFDTVPGYEELLLFGSMQDPFRLQSLYLPLRPLEVSPRRLKDVGQLRDRRLVAVPLAAIGSLPLFLSGLQCLVLGGEKL
jgi:hypothetical protein